MKLNEIPQPNLYTLDHFDNQLLVNTSQHLQFQMTNKYSHYQYLLCKFFYHSILVNTK